MTSYFEKAHAHDADRNVSLLGHDQYAREVLCIDFADNPEKALLIERVKRGCIERKQAVPNQWRLSLAQHARDRLVECYQPLILKLAASFARSGSSYEMPDFASEGTIGLLLLLDRLESYDRLNVAIFHTLAVAYIEGYMLQAFKHRDGMVRVSDYSYKLLKKLERVLTEWEETQVSEPTPDDLAHEMGVPVAKVHELLVYRDRRWVASLEGLIDESNAEEHLDFVGLYASTVAPEETRPTPLREAIEVTLAMTLNTQSREEEVVRTRYGLDDGPGEVRTYELVASMLAMGERMAQYYDKRAIQKLRPALAKYVRPAPSSGMTAQVA